MLHSILTGLLAVSFFGAGAANAIGRPATQASFVRWGYPAWWRRVTGALEMADAVLIALLATRPVGLVLGAIVITAAVVTVVRHRELSHLAPLGVFTVLLGAAAFSS